MVAELMGATTGVLLPTGQQASEEVIPAPLGWDGIAGAVPTICLAL